MLNVRCCEKGTVDFVNESLLHLCLRGDGKANRRKLRLISLGGEDGRRC